MTEIRHRMVALKFTHNGEAPVVAGAADLAVLSVILSAAGYLGPDSHGTRGPPDQIDVEVRGLTARADRHKDEHLVWRRSNAAIGDTITVEMVEADKGDEPSHRKSKSADRALLLPMRRRQARRRRGPYKRRHVMYPVRYDD